MKIVVGGQIDKKELANMVESIGGDKVEVEIKSDLEAAMAVKNGVADYYLGACNTGGGGALGMAIALLGRDNTSTLSMPGSLKSETDIRHEVSSGKKAFGFTAQHMDKVVPIIMDELLK
ncbi:DUF2620 domain-containing protein [Ruoffia tabacinasalis]|uniref:DUF2620 domain-containing protein n=1 Tax=Ruoffia tabacinasalis TaxID=87458 RepID=A0A5R9DTL7_9LACT|nr:DUF2620 domain-containing protein [Ruoffia tabacinasalis]TLQ40160.1 DUF2620 domain-containing protein [Ruoffia tabacinasalis]